MAKGKYGARAAIRRIEAADAHIDTLTSQVVDAKMRARQNETAARLVPVLQARISELESELEVATSPEVRRLKKEVDEARREWALAYEDARKIKERWEDLAFFCMQRVLDGTSLERVEELMRILGEDATWIERGVHGSVDDPLAARRIQKARGRRTRGGDVATVVGRPMRSQQVAETVMIGKNVKERDVWHHAPADEDGPEVEPVAG